MKEEDQKEEQDRGFSDEELDLMTEEERKALTEGEEEGESGEKEKAGEEAGEEGSQGEQGSQEVAAPTPTFIPVLKMDVSDADIQTKLDDLDKQLEEGDIDIIQYTKQRDPLIQQRTESQLAAKFNQQAADQLWNSEKRLFFNNHPEYQTDPVLNGALQRVFRDLDTEQNVNKTGLELLHEARLQVEGSLARFASKSSAPGAERQPSQPAGGKEPQRSARETVSIPRTLGALPSAESNDTAPGEFAYLDGLANVEYEKALSKLTPDQRERYLRQP